MFHLVVDGDVYFSDFSVAVMSFYSPRFYCCDFLKEREIADLEMECAAHTSQAPSFPTVAAVDVSGASSASDTFQTSMALPELDAALELQLAAIEVRCTTALRALGHEQNRHSHSQNRNQQQPTTDPKEVHSAKSKDDSVNVNRSIPTAVAELPASKSNAGSEHVTAGAMLVVSSSPPQEVAAATSPVDTKAPWRSPRVMAAMASHQQQPQQQPQDEKHEVVPPLPRGALAQQQQQATVPPAASSIAAAAAAISAPTVGASSASRWAVGPPASDIISATQQQQQQQQKSQSASAVSTKAKGSTTTTVSPQVPPHPADCECGDRLNSGTVDPKTFASERDQWQTSTSKKKKQQQQPQQSSVGASTTLSRPPQQQSSSRW